MIAGTAVGAYGQIQSGKAQEQAYKAQAEQDRNNAILADRRAKDAIERGQYEENKARQEASIREKGYEASFAAANIDTSYGSPLDFITAAAQQGEMDAAIIRMNSEREAEDFNMQGYNSRASANQKVAAGSNAAQAGMISGIGSALTGGSGAFKYRASIT